MANDNLTGQTISSTYNQLLITADTGGITGSGSSATQIHCGGATAGAGNADTTALYLSTNRIGIGTASPTNTLDVATGTGQIIIGDSKTDGTTKEATILSHQYDTVNDPEGFVMINANSTDGVNEVRMGGGHSSFNSATELQFYTTASGDSDRTGDRRMTILANGNVGIGTATPETILEISTGSTDVDLDVAFSTYSDDPGTFSTLILRKADGTEADPDLVTDNDVLGEVRFDAWDKDTGGNFLAGAYIRAAVNGTPGENDMPTELIFATTADSGSAPTERMWINQAGYVGIGEGTPTVRLHVEEDRASNFVALFANDGANSNRYGIGISCGEDTPGDAGDCRFISFLDGDDTAVGGIQSSSTPANPEFFNGSDKRMKKDIAPTAIKGLDSINALPLSEWNWNHPTKIMPKQAIGIVADDLEKVLPREVSTKVLAGWGHLGDIKTVPTETTLSFIMMKAIQELSAKVDALENNNQQGESSNEQEQEEPDSGASASESAGEDSGRNEGDSTDSSDTASGTSEASNSSSDDGNESAGSSGSDASDDSEGGSGGDDSGGSEGESSGDSGSDSVDDG